MHNIAIYEGGKASRMQGVALITTDDGEGGRVTWVPQDDRKTGTLHVSSNGTYRAEDEGLHSWSKVTVRLAGAPVGMTTPTMPDPITGAEIPTGEIGEIDPVAPAGLEPLDDIEPISIEEAEAIATEAGYDADALDPESPDYADAMEAIADALGTDPDNVKIVDPDDPESAKEAQPNKVKDEGQKAEGIDQETGETTTITPSGKEGAEVPDELRIIVEPSKKSYEDGDTIDFSGIQCALYSNGKFLRNVGIDELTFPVTTATYDGERPEYTDGNGVNAVYLVTHQDISMSRTSNWGKWTTRTVYVTPPTGIRYTNSGIVRDVAFGSKSGNGSIYLTQYNGNYYAKMGEDGDKSIVGYLFEYIPEEPDKPQTRAGWNVLVSGSVTVNRNRFITLNKKTLEKYGISAPTSTTDPNEVGPAWFAAGQKQTIPVKFGSLGDDFKITVTYDNVQG